MEENNRPQEFAVEYKLGLLLALTIPIGWIFRIQRVFGIEPSILGHLSMFGQSFMIDSVFNLSRRNILAAMFAHQALGTSFVFLYIPQGNWILTLLVWAFVLILRIIEERRLLETRETESKKIQEADIIVTG